MTAVKQTSRICLAFAVMAGCHVASHAPDPVWVADFERADAVAVRKQSQQIIRSDAATIIRLKDIYANAEWKPYWHTLPGDLNDRTIKLLAGDRELRHFSYTGMLWERNPSNEHRTAELLEADRQWIESLFNEVPDAASARDE